MPALEHFLESSRRRKRQLDVPSLEEAAASVEPQRGRSFLENLFAWLDQPGAVVRNLLTGNVVDALENVGHFASLGAYDARDKKGSYAPDWGFWGNLVSDPLLYFTGGASGAAKTITKAAAGVGAKRYATKAAARGLGKSLTKAGKRHIDEYAQQLVAKAPDRARQAALLKVVRRGGQIDDVLTKMASGTPAHEVLPGLGRELLDEGGLKIGLPFMEGKTVGLAGKNVNLLDLTPIPYAARAAGKLIRKTPAGYKALAHAGDWARNLISKLYFGKYFTQEGRLLGHTRNAKIAQLDRVAGERLSGLFGGWDKAARRDFTQTLSGLDVTGSGVTNRASFLAKHPELAYDDALEGWKKIVDEMADESRELGILGEYPFSGKHEKAREIFRAADAGHRERMAALANQTAALTAKSGKEAKGLLARAEKLETETARVMKIRLRELEDLKLKADELAAGRSPLELQIEGLPTIPGGVKPNKAAARKARARARRMRQQIIEYQSRRAKAAASLRKEADRVARHASKAAKRAREIGERKSLRMLEKHRSQGQRILDAIPERDPNAIYFPQQYTDDVREAIELANIEARRLNIDDAFKAGVREPQAGVAMTSKFLETRKFDQPDFLLHVKDKMDKARQLGVPAPKNLQEMDIVELGLKRLKAHNRNVANVGMMRSAEARELVDRAFGDWVKQGAGALKRRKGVMSAVDFVNRKFFKPYVTIGLGVVPNPAFHVRNMGSGIWQAATHRDIGTAAGLRHIWEIVNGGIAKAVEKIPGMPKVPRTQLNRVLAGEATDAIVKGTDFTELQVRELLESQGVTRQSFVRAEDIVSEVGPVLKEAKGKFGKKAYETLLGTKFPSMVAEGIEDRMRANGFIAALRKGLSPEDAAQAVREAFIDYQIVSGTHRAVRDVIPFAQFTIGQTPRTIATALESPRALIALRELQRDRDEGGPVPPYVAEQPSILLGPDLEGNPAHLVGMGTPFEDINKFWSGRLGRTLEKSIGQTAPPLKALYETASGREPFFGREVGGYRRDTPFARLLPDPVVGRKKRTVKTPDGGEKEISEVSPKFLRALQYLPVSRQISMYNQLFDERKSVWQKSISLLTGVKVVSVDEERELKRIIGEYLKDRAKAGDIGQFQRFFTKGDVEPELAALVKAYYHRREGK